MEEKKKFRFRPLHDLVAVLPDVMEKTSAGGIVIPDTVDLKANRGVVLASGPGVKGFANTTKPGDVVYFPKMAGEFLTVEDFDFLLISESHLQLIDPEPPVKPNPGVVFGE